MWRERSREMRRWVSACAGDVRVARGSLRRGCVAMSAEIVRLGATALGCGKLGQRALTAGAVLSCVVPMVQ